MSICRQRGFTIIEMIVVLAIIAVLATIVVAALTSYITSAKDATVKSDVEDISKDLNLYYSQNGTFSSFTGPSVTPPCSAYTINKTSSHFAVYAKLCSSANYWCIDDTGKKAQMSSTPAGSSCN
jgi:prepilin-type N-terminal cleavage/methylation domain-containing protein